MKRLSLPFLLALLSVSMAVPGCAGPFEACVKPALSKITWQGTAEEIGDLVANMLICDPAFTSADLPACAVQEIAILESTLGPGGKEVVDCLILYWQNHGAPNVQTRARAMAVRRGLHTAPLTARLQCGGVTVALR